MTARSDDCGCAMSARFIAAALVASIVWYVWHWHDAELSFGGVCLRVFGFSILAGLVGKIVGLAWAKAHFLKHQGQNPIKRVEQVVRD